MSARHWLGSTLIAAALGCGACAERQPDLRLQLESFDPAVRVQAVTSVAEEGITSLIPALVDRLDDEDSAVRLYTILALEKLTSQRLGYAYSAPRVQRRAAIENWRRYVSNHAQTPSDAQTPTDGQAPTHETPTHGAAPGEMVPGETNKSDPKPDTSPRSATTPQG